MTPDRDAAFDTLLDLHGQTLFVDEAGHWVKFIAVRTDVTPQYPHGLRCSLVLHAPDGERLVGFNNAHPVRERRGPGTQRRRESDHRHWRQSIGPYEYWCAAVLLEDFWNEVAAVLKERVSAP